MSYYTSSEAVVRFAKDKKVKETGAFSKGVNKGLNIIISAHHYFGITRQPHDPCRRCEASGAGGVDNKADDGTRWRMVVHSLWE